MIKKIAFTTCFIIQTLPLEAVSIVYNFRIAQITRRQFLRSSDYHRHTGLLIFDHWRKKRDETRQHFIGGFSSFIYNTESIYFRIDGAVPFQGNRTPVL